MATMETLLAEKMKDVPAFIWFERVVHLVIKEYLRRAIIGSHGRVRGRGEVVPNSSDSPTAHNEAQRLMSRRGGESAVLSCIGRQLVQCYGNGLSRVRF
jgi:hypothetical protein